MGMKTTAVMMSLIVLSTGSSQAATTSRAARLLDGQCAAEAKWPQTASHEWRNAGAHRRVQISQGFSADVSQAQTLCRQWRLVPVSQIGALKLRSDSFLAAQAAKYGQAGDNHVSRLSGLFAGLAQARDGRS